MLVFAILVSHKVMWESDITHEDFLSGTSVFGSLTERFLYAQKKWHQEHWVGNVALQHAITSCTYCSHVRRFAPTPLSPHLLWGILQCLSVFTWGGVLYHVIYWIFTMSRGTTSVTSGYSWRKRIPFSISSQCTHSINLSAWSALLIWLPWRG